MKLVTANSKPLPCCARCKKWSTPRCENYMPSFLCEYFDNDGTADTHKYAGAYRINDYYIS